MLDVEQVTCTVSHFCSCSQGNFEFAHLSLKYLLKTVRKILEKNTYTTHVTNILCQSLRRVVLAVPGSLCDNHGPEESNVLVNIRHDTSRESCVTCTTTFHKQ